MVKGSCSDPLAVPLRIYVEFVQKEMLRAFLAHRIITHRLTFSVYKCVVLVLLHLLGDASLRIHQLKHVLDLVIGNNSGIVPPPYHLCE